MTYLPLFEFETQVMQIWKTAIYCYQQFRQSYVRVTVDWIILKLTNTPMMVVVIPFDSTSKIHIPVSWIQWAPPTVILVTIKGANTHFFEEVRKTGGGRLELFYSIVSLFSSKLYNEIFIFPYLHELKKVRRGDL